MWFLVKEQKSYPDVLFVFKFGGIQNGKSTVGRFWLWYSHFSIINLVIVL